MAPLAGPRHGASGWRAELAWAALSLGQLPVLALLALPLSWLAGAGGDRAPVGAGELAALPVWLALALVVPVAVAVLLLLLAGPAIRSERPEARAGWIAHALAAGAGAAIWALVSGAGAGSGSGWGTAALLGSAAVVLVCWPRLAVDAWHRRATASRAGDAARGG